MLHYNSATKLLSRNCLGVAKFLLTSRKLILAKGNNIEYLATFIWET